MIKFPLDIDDDASIPVVNDNINEIGGEAINALRDATIALETELGIGASGTAGSVAQRLSVALLPDGHLKPSELTSLGLVTLPITNDQIANNAGILESKLHLDYRTSDLFNYIRDVARETNINTGWISTSGSKLEPHIAGFAFFHTLRHILVSDPSEYLTNKFGALRDNSSAYTLVKDMNSELVSHQLADGSPFGTIKNVTTNNGSTYPSNYGHTASGIFLNTSKFVTIPQTLQDLQLFADFIDNSSIFLLGSRIQNLYSNGISKVSRSSSFLQDGYGQPLTETVTATAYLLNGGISTSPYDDISKGDDIIELFPSGTLSSSNVFDSQFALVKVGDIIRVNYGTVEVPFLIREKKYIQNGTNKQYIVRINGKNLLHTTTATARIDRSLINPNKYGVLAMAQANNTFSEVPSLIVGSPRGAEALGIGFNPDLLDNTHYLLYLALYPTGNPKDGYTVLPGIDVTGNKGATPGKYTLESVVEATNEAFRQNGFNYRFIAFSYQGNFGIKLADSYQNAAFSIISAVVDDSGAYDQTLTNTNFKYNVIDVFATTLTFAPDALGFGPSAANLASPPYKPSYGTPAAANLPTKLFVALKRNNYYVNGLERDQLASDIGQVIDQYGDTYWQATVKAVNPIPAPAPAGHVEITYSIPLNLSNSNLKAGKTLVVQSLDSGGTLVDFGRFIIKSVNFTNCAPDYVTEITVYDGVHATGLSPYSVLSVGSKVALYFDSSSVSFNLENATDISLSSAPAFKRYFEVFVTEDGHTFTHERARINVSGATITVNGSVPLYANTELGKFNIVKISSKLKGYQFGQVQKITLHIDSYSATSGIYSGYLGEFNGTSFISNGKVTYGKKGEVTRFYDSTNVDYVDLVFDINESMSGFANANIDIQVFPTLSLDDEVMLIGTCQYNDVTKKLSYLRDCRQFGNTSEKDLSTSALNLISLPEKLLHANGVIRGFDIAVELAPIPSSEIHIMGGTVLVDGKLIQMNDAKLHIPAIQEYYTSSYYNINWALCVNNKNEYQFIPLLDYDTVLATPNDTTRLMKVFNPTNGSSYYVDATTFSDIVNQRKDLTILYLVAATVTPAPLPATISLSLTDARRYVTDVDNNLPLKLTVGNSQGNFKDPISIINWVTWNNKFNSTANFNGADTTSGIINIPVRLDFEHSTIFEGENNAALIFNQNVTLGSNISFRNMRIDFNGLLTVLSGASNITFENCTIFITTPTSVVVPSNVIFDFNASDNITFKNCSINVVYTEEANGGAVFRLTSSGKFRFDGNDLDVQFKFSNGQEVPGQVFIIRSHSQVNAPHANTKITDSRFSGNFLQFMVNSASNVYMDRLDITSTHQVSVTPDIYLSDATNGMPYGFTFDKTDFVNSGRGYIYCDVSQEMYDIVINRVNFNYKPTNADGYRLSFINFDLSSNTAKLDDVTITNCKFNSTSVPTDWDDLAPAIAIINKASVVTSINPQPVISNIEIANNHCNRNQMILLTSVCDGYGEMLYPGLVASNVNIHDNICGTIGYWTAADTKFINVPPTINSYTDKNSGLNIKDNICHYIASMDHKGRYWYPVRVIHGMVGDYTVNQCNYPSGFVTISGNKSNWIHTAITTTENSALQIMKNSLCAYDSNYWLNYHTGPTGSGLGTSSGFAITVGANVHQFAATSADTDYPDSPCVISGNSVGAGYWLQTSFTSQTYRYLGGYIYSQGSSQITDNVLKGIDSFIVGGFPLSAGILVGGANNIVTNNRIYRNGKTILAYVAFGSPDFPVWNGEQSHGIVTENFFDSPWISDAAHTDVTEYLVNITTLGTAKASKWIIERNINQTLSVSVPLTTSQLFGSFGMATTTIEPPYNLNLFVATAPGVDAVGSNVVGLYKSQVLWLHEATIVTPAIRVLGWQENLDKYLPNSVRIIKAQLGVRSFDSLVDPANSQIYLSLNRYTFASDYVNLDYFTGPPTGSAPYPAGIRDAKILNDTSPQAALLTGMALNSTNLTIPMIIDTTTAGPSGTDISDQFTTGRGTSYSITLDLKYSRTAGVDLDLYFSPLLIKYRW